MIPITSYDLSRRSTEGFDLQLDDDLQTVHFIKPEGGSALSIDRETLETIAAAARFTAQKEKERRFSQTTDGAFQEMLKAFEYVGPAIFNPDSRRYGDPPTGACDIKPSRRGHREGYVFRTGKTRRHYSGYGANAKGKDVAVTHFGDVKEFRAPEGWAPGGYAASDDEPEKGEGAMGE